MVINFPLNIEFHPHDMCEWGGKNENISLEEIGLVRHAEAGRINGNASSDGT